MILFVVLSHLPDEEDGSVILRWTALDCVFRLGVSKCVALSLAGLIIIID